MSVLGLIPARGGSKGLPGKNIRPLGGRPLIAWTIQAALEASEVSRVLVSTDDPDIAAAAAAAGAEVPALRPAELARDDTAAMDVVRHALDAWASPDEQEVALLQPTSPLRTAEDIDGCVRERRRLGAPICVSVCEADKPPWWIFSLDAHARLEPFMERPAATRRQDLPPAYALNGAVYTAAVDALRGLDRFVTPDTAAYVMAKSRSVDIDDAVDFALAEALMAQRREAP